MERLGIFAATIISTLMVAPVVASVPKPAVAGPPGVSTGPATAPSRTSGIPASAVTGAPTAPPVVAFGSASAVPAPTLPAGTATITAMASTPDGAGYWLATATGQVFATGDAVFEGSMGARPSRATVVAVAPTADGRGYWLATADGGVFSFGDATFAGSMPGVPIVAMAASPDGRGYWLVASDGRVFSFGSAAYHGGAGALSLAAPIVAMAATPDGGGYWLVAADGGVLSFGDARFQGSLGATPVDSPIVGMARPPDGGGYWLLAADGGVSALGDARPVGSKVSRASPAVAMAATNGGYWVAFGHDPLGPSVAAFVATRADNVTAAVYDVATGELFGFRPGVVEHTASTVKLDILAALLQDCEAAGRAPTPAELAQAVPMIEDSSDSAADALWVEVGATAVARFEGDVGMESTTPATDGVWGRSTTTAEDRIDAVRAVALPNQVLTDASRAYILHLMRHITPSQDWGATGGVPSDVTVALKNGFSIIDGWQINTEGWVVGLGRDYVIAVLTDHNPSEDYGIQTVDGVSALVWQALGG